MWLDMQAHAFLEAITIVLCVAAVTTVVFQRLRQPVVLGYILAGLVVGPHVPIPLVADRESIQVLSELGVILLMFSLGLEFSVRRLVQVGPTAGLTAVIQSSVMVWLGFVVARAFGWTARESIFAGALIAISSTTIIAKAFDEQGIKGRLRELVVGVLIVEDLIALVLLVAFPLAAVTQPFLPRWAVVAAFAVLLAVLAVVFWRSAANLHGHVKAGAQTIVEALVTRARKGAAAADRDALAQIDQILPGLGTPTAVRLDETSPAVGRTLAELDLRALTGASVLAIARGDRGVIVPLATEALRAGDVLALAGTHDAVAAAKAMLLTGPGAPSS
jgi:hypothetical protein